MTEQMLPLFGYKHGGERKTVINMFKLKMNNG